jgi:hypothetical protein
MEDTGLGCGGDDTERWVLPFLDAPQKVFVSGREPVISNLTLVTRQELK